MEAIGTGEGPCEIIWATRNAHSFTTRSTVIGTAQLASVDSY